MESEYKKLAKSNELLMSQLSKIEEEIKKKKNKK